ncbi:MULTISPECIES: SNF2-related protein [unclassified Solwaraspora]|uniref:SNF2-related protein n=1 Tax=unclassified Solwaraspora TaxID=2627926 RepID=UPI00248B2A13|nr:MULTISPECIES: SNF2-related protein [unclassified Solwaraspora]WBB98147.1 SNF2-related protein [Solwaraspora sp. WMMA2059]WJK34619.1 SNF2-related protein [Solwaraspora sp. WMMA2065]
MAKLELTVEEAALCEIVGVRAFLRARAQLADGELTDARWDPTTGHAQGRLDPGRGGTVTAAVTTDPDGLVATVDGACSCGERSCGHPYALVLQAVVGAAPTVPQQRQAPDAPTADWEKSLSALVSDVAPVVTAAPARATVGLQFELVKPGAAGAGGPAGRIALRPVVPGQTGWVRSGISWSNVQYAGYGRSPESQRHRQLLGEILTLSRLDEDRYGYYSHPTTIFLDAFASRRIWDLLAEADDAGLPLVQPGKYGRPVVVGRQPARLSVQVDRADDELIVQPVLLADGVPVAAEFSVFVGRPAHGIAWWAERGGVEPQPRDRVLRLAPLSGAVSAAAAKALAGPAIRVPAADEARFLERFYPELLKQVEVVAAGPAVHLPPVLPPTLTLAMTPMPGQALSIHWQWVRAVGAHRQTEPLWATGPRGHADSRGHADPRDAVVDQVTEATAKAVPEAIESTPNGPRLAALTTLTGDAMIRFLSEVLPRLADLDGVEVVESAAEPVPDYRESDETPVIRFAGTDHPGEHDWFDLSVQVSVGGEQVIFDQLFTALAQDRQYLILPSGTYFSLDRPEFAQLRELIDESRALEDRPPGVLRVGRFQAGLWAELAELGEITGQAAAWQRAVRELATAGAAVDHQVPSQVRAELRPYQLDGFRWLAALREHQLGGILADDMGLGKTLQTLALIRHARADVPFLVVAPASVIHNWVAEAARFTPDLTVRAVTQTSARRGVALAEAATGADIVVTSYTLLRLEFDDYQALDWAGLILDEAQFVKNHQSQSHRCAKQLTAPFKLAITGTPMENNLLELWALCSITAPGLFPRLDRFTDYYRGPIERDRDGDRLAQLRRRIRPLMLRRRKADVAADLPEKQEQVLELDLDRKHRRIYQAYLQRERQKVLGLLGDLEKNRFEIFRSLTLLRQASLDVALVDPRHEGVPSTKLDVLADQITNLVAEGHRTLVFSQFTRFLGAARDRLVGAGVRCGYLDGSTTNRAAVIAEFKRGDADVFLISLKAGGFGLNLTEADYCILLDPWWNPATEAQAVDRVHRIGQTSNVMVYRMVAKDTIEEKVMALKQRKAELFSSVLDGGEFASAQLSAADIRDLLDLD